MDSGFLSYAPRGFLSRIVVFRVFLYNISEFEKGEYYFG